MILPANRIELFASEDESRPSLCGVHYNKALRRLECTDGRRLAVIPLMEDEVFPEDVDCVIPTAVVQFVRKIKQKKARWGNPPPVLLHLNEKEIEVHSPDGSKSVFPQSIEATYPKVEHVIPAPYKAIRFSFDTKFVRDACVMLNPDNDRDLVTIRVAKDAGDRTGPFFIGAPNEAIPGRPGSCVIVMPCRSESHALGDDEEDPAPAQPEAQVPAEPVEVEPAATEPEPEPVVEPQEPQPAEVKQETVVELACA